ncbi:MAG: ribose-phosphate diphosphokinase [Pseudomonadales bacterium]
MSGRAGPGGPALVIGFPDYEAPARRLAEAAGLPYESVTVHRFPDGESRLLLPQALPAHCVLCRSLDHPDAKLVQLILAAAGARGLGAKRLTLVAPYLCYMRQDKAFHPGEVVSQRIVGELLGRYFDGVLTVDAHLHRVHSLIEAVPVPVAVNLTPDALMAGLLAHELEDPYLLGPDAESEQWVRAIAAPHGFAFGVASKVRYGDRDVAVRLPRGIDPGRHVVLIDDVASTGRTLLAATRALAAHRPASISVLVTHAMFVDDADQQLRDAGVEHIWSCDSIVHPTNRLALAEPMAERLSEFRIPAGKHGAASL